MRTKREIVEYLQSVNSLLNGALEWDGVLEEAPMEFCMPAFGYSFRAQPEILSFVSPAFSEQKLDLFNRGLAKNGIPRLLIATYLSPQMIARLNESAERIMAVDLSGNGLIKTGKVYFCDTHNDNIFPRKSRVCQPFRGTAAQVAMALLTAREWRKQQDVLQYITAQRGQLSQSQLSKTLRAYEESGVILRQKGAGITVIRPEYLLLHLLQDWALPKLCNTNYRRLKSGVTWDTLLERVRLSGVAWCYSPASSLRRYASCDEAGPREIWTARSAIFEELTVPCLSPALAELQLSSIYDRQAFFQNYTDENGEVWSGPVQTWIVATRGDARQQEIAKSMFPELMTFNYAGLTPNDKNV